MAATISDEQQATTAHFNLFNIMVEEQVSLPIEYIKEDTFNHLEFDDGYFDVTVVGGRSSVPESPHSFTVCVQIPEVIRMFRNHELLVESDLLLECYMYDSITKTFNFNRIFKDWLDENDIIL